MCESWLLSEGHIEIWSSAQKALDPSRPCGGELLASVRRRFFATGTQVPGRRQSPSSSFSFLLLN